MELTISVQDLSRLVIKSNDGEVYRIVKEEDCTKFIKQMEDLTDKSRRRIVTQTELMKLLGVGHSRIKKWTTEGLGEIQDGNRVYYDLEEVYRFMNNKKI